MNGIVKRIVPGRNYGFIKHNVTNVEYFFHKDDFTGFWSDLESDSASGAKTIPVEFEIADSPKGPRAKDVRRTDHPN